MCLYVHRAYHRSFHPVPAIAREDKHVYKVLLTNGSKYITPYRQTQVIFTDDIGILSATLINILITVTCGIHAFRNYERAMRSGAFLPDPRYKLIICNAVIPKGTKYFIGTNDDIVAEKLIIFKTEEAFKTYALKNGNLCA